MPSNQKSLSPKYQNKSFIDTLEEILRRTKELDEIRLGEILKILSTKGYAAIFIIASFPFCTPLFIPGFSTPFGIILAFLGLRLALNKKPWWPKWFQDKKLSSDRVNAMIVRFLKIFKPMQKFTYPRLVVFTQATPFLRLSGGIIFIVAILLTLPLILPLSNVFAALPILFIGLGLLEDDGLLILISYILTIFCLLYFISAFFLIKALII